LPSQPGDQILSDWFTLAKRKQKDTVSGLVQITVIYGHKTKSTPKVEKKKPKKDDKEEKEDGEGMPSFELSSPLFTLLDMQSNEIFVFHQSL